MRISLLLHLLFICAHKELCSSYVTRTIYVGSVPGTIEAKPPYEGSAAWRFLVSDVNGHLTLTVNTGLTPTRNCSNHNSVISIKEAYDNREVFLCGDGDYESHGTVVTAFITWPHFVRITYRSRSKSYHCINEFHATPTGTVLRSTDTLRSSMYGDTCRWSIQSRTGYNVRVRVLESKLQLPCSSNTISVDVDVNSTLSWCGAETSSFSSYHSTLVIRFNRSSIADGHGFVISITEVPEPNPVLISSCESSYNAYLEPHALTVNIHSSYIHDIPTYEQNKRLCSLTLVTSNAYVVQVSVRRSSLPSPCYSHAVQVFEGPHLRTSWCENSTPSFRSLGNNLKIWYNASSLNDGSFSLKYHAVLRPPADIPHCDFISQIYNQTNHSPSSKDAWWLCRTALYATTFPRTLTATKDEFFTGYPHYERLTREWRISGSYRGVYVEIEKNPNLSCSRGVIRVYDCEAHNSNYYRYLGSSCYGRNNTFRTASCLALRFNATNLPSGSNTIFSLTYRNPDTWSHETTTRWPWIPANHTMHPVCSEATRILTSGIQSQVLTIPAISSVTCRWRLTTSEPVDSENPIELKLESRRPAIRSHDMCYDRYLEVFDGPSSSSPLLAKWCGLSNQTLVSTGQHMFLVYTGGYRYPWLSWPVHYKTIADDMVTDPASQTASTSSQTGTIVGSVFGVVLLVLAVAGALIGWRIYRRKKMSPYQNSQITRQREAGSSVFSVTKPSFSNAFYGQVKSPGHDKEGKEDPDTPDTNYRPVFQQNEYMTVYQPLDPTFPNGNVEGRSATYDNHCNDGKDVSAPDNVYSIPHIYDRPEVNIYQDLPQYQPLNIGNVKGNVKGKSVTYDNLCRGANMDSEI
ncbi:uncharacterized protein LOC124271935 [Haliotis rubra]|uniref:uncharacterized protein LOC124271935 n=1 Tax=Haliotis rubra TaxID=36100 RepID=UPI001EE56C0A|nr:uncharacterized protein LOC124271935 [Haliotis rubra]